MGGVQSKSCAPSWKCCSSAISNEADVLVPLHSAIDPVDVFEFKMEIEGVSVDFLLQDRETRSNGIIRLDKGLASLVIMCDGRVRAIPLSRIVSVMHDEMWIRNNGWASIFQSAEISHCAALQLHFNNDSHLNNSIQYNNCESTFPMDMCLPLIFRQKQEKDLFVQVTQRIMKVATYPYVHQLAAV